MFKKLCGPIWYNAGMNLRSCGCIVLIINAIFGTLSVQYLAKVFLQKDINALVAFVIGFFFGEVTIPVAIVTWLLKEVF